MPKPRFLMLCIAIASSSAALAETTAPAPEQMLAAADNSPVRPRKAAGQPDEVIVNAVRVELDTPAATGSRLGLSVRETPASIEVVTQQQMQLQGLRNVEEVYATIPGVTAGNLPGEPGMTSMRGFSSSAISYLFDGVRAADSSMMSRNFDSFNFEKIEVL